jgi:hypothetical protein
MEAPMAFSDRIYSAQHRRERRFVVKNHLARIVACIMAPIINRKRRCRPAPLLRENVVFSLFISPRAAPTGNGVRNFRGADLCRFRGDRRNGSATTGIRTMPPRWMHRGRYGGGQKSPCLRT